MQSKSAELIQKIKSTVNILDVVGEHVVLRKTGANFVGLCPFHSERSPSFSVSEAKQLYHCYGCKKGGDLVSFIMEILGISFVEALDELGERARIPIAERRLGSSRTAEQESELKSKQNTAYKLNRFVATFFHRYLEISQNAKNYVRKRGIDAHFGERFYVGAAQDSWDALSRHLVAGKAPMPLAVELGLIRPSKRTDLEGSIGYFDLFRNRVIFPILNQRGKVAGFGGRALGAEDSPKYLNSPESLIFQKGKLIFGLYQAQKFIRESDRVILVEGYFDVLALHRAGFQNVVSTCGTSLTPDHLRILSRLTNQIVILFDGDSAGIAATERVMEVGLEAGQVLYGASIPSGKDPDEILLHEGTGEVLPEGVNRMTTLLGESKPLLDLKIQQTMEEGRASPQGQTEALKKISAWLSKFADPVGKEVRLQWVEKELGVHRRVLGFAGGTSPVIQNQNQNKNKNPTIVKVANDPKRAPAQKEVPPADRALLKALFSGEKFVLGLLEFKNLAPEGVKASVFFESIAISEWFEEVLSDAALFEKLKNEPNVLVSESYSMSPELRSVLTEVLLSEQSVEWSDFETLLMVRLAKIWARFSHRIKELIAQAEVRKNREEQDRLMKEYLDVQRKMKEFSNFYDEA